MNATNGTVSKITVRTTFRALPTMFAAGPTKENPSGTATAKAIAGTIKDLTNLDTRFSSHL